MPCFSFDGFNNVAKILSGKIFTTDDKTQGVIYQVSATKSVSIYDPELDVTGKQGIILVSQGVYI